jgi:hypothetical protein
MAAGDVVVVYNASGGNMTLAQAASMTCRLAGTTLTGNRTIAPRGVAHIWFASPSEALISGSGVS